MSGIIDNVDIIEGRAPTTEVTTVPDGSGGQMSMLETMMIKRRHRQSRSLRRGPDKSGV